MSSYLHPTSPGATSGSPQRRSQESSNKSFTEQFESAMNEEMQRMTSTTITKSNANSPPKYPQVQETEVSESYLPPTSTEPGFASEALLQRGLQVTPHSTNPTSGFPYPPLLASSNVSRSSWAAFTSEIQSMARLSKQQWLTTVGAASATLSVGALMVGVLAVIPSIIVGKKYRKAREDDNLVTADKSGELAECVERWNREYFSGRGLVVRVDVPGSAVGMEDMDVYSEKKSTFRKSPTPNTSLASSPSGSYREGSKEAKRDEAARMMAARKGRIVIIPMNGAQESMFAGNENERAGQPALDDGETLWSKGDFPTYRGQRDMYPDEPKP